jgi:hypothetical protein
VASGKVTLEKNCGRFLAPALYAALDHDRFNRNRSWSLAVCVSHDLTQIVGDFLGSCSRATSALRKLLPFGSINF